MPCLKSFASQEEAATIFTAATSQESDDRIRV